MARRKGVADHGVQMAVQERQTKVAQMYCQGLSQSAIGAQLGVTQPTVSQDLKAVRERWLVLMVRDFAERKAEELAKVDHLEATCWEAWEASCRDREVKMKRRNLVRQSVKGTGGTKKPGHRLIVMSEQDTATTSGQCGDVRFLERIAWCIETRMKLMGLLGDAPPPAKPPINWDALFSAAAAPNEADRELAELEAHAAAVSPPAQPLNPTAPPTLHFDGPPSTNGVH